MNGMRPAPGKIARIARVLGPVIALAMCSDFCRAESVYSATAVKAAYLYRFASYIEWPRTDSPPSEFTILVIQGHDVAVELAALSAGRQIKGRAVRIVELSHSRDIPTAQLAYVGPDLDFELRRLIRALGSRHIAVVTDEPGGLDQGGLINFVVADQRIRFEVSLITARRAQLAVSSELLSVAARVEGSNQAMNVALDPRFARLKPWHPALPY